MQYINTHAQNDWFICIMKTNGASFEPTEIILPAMLFNGGYEMMENF